MITLLITEGLLIKKIVHPHKEIGSYFSLVFKNDDTMQVTVMLTISTSITKQVSFATQVVNKPFMNVCLVNIPVLI